MTGLVDFVWHDKPVEREGVQGFEGSAKDSETGAIVPIFVPFETLDALDKRDELMKAQ